MWPKEFHLRVHKCILIQSKSWHYSVFGGNETLHIHTRTRRHTHTHTTHTYTHRHKHTHTQKLCVCVSLSLFLSLSLSLSFPLSLSQIHNTHNTQVRTHILWIVSVVCWRIQTYADIYWRTLTCVDIHWRLLTYADWIDSVVCCRLILTLDTQ